MLNTVHDVVYSVERQIELQLMSNKLRFLTLW